MVPILHTMLLYALLILFLLPMLPLLVFSAFIAPRLCSLFKSTDISFRKPLLLFPALSPMWISHPFQLPLCYSMHIIFTCVFIKTTTKWALTVCCFELNRIGLKTCCVYFSFPIQCSLLILCCL